MENIIVRGNNEIPTINFLNNGNLWIMGRSLPLNTHLVYKPLIDFVTKLKVPFISLSIDLEYMNSGSVKQILSILYAIESNTAINQANVKWHFDDDDDDTLNIGKMFEESLKKCKFSFLENIAD